MRILCMYLLISQENLLKNTTVVSDSAYSLFSFFICTSNERLIPAISSLIITNRVARYLRHFRIIVLDPGGSSHVQRAPPDRTWESGRWETESPWQVRRDRCGCCSYTGCAIDPVAPANIAHLRRIRLYSNAGASMALNVNVWNSTFFSLLHKFYF